MAKTMLVVLFVSLTWAGCCQSDCEDEGLDTATCERYCDMKSSSSTSEMAETYKSSALSSKRFDEYNQAVKKAQEMRK